MKVLEERPDWSTKIRCGDGLRESFAQGCNSLLLIDKNDVRYVAPGTGNVMGVDDCFVCQCPVCGRILFVRDLPYNLKETIKEETFKELHSRHVR